MENVFFSVVIPLYNKESYIKECIESVLCQSYSNFEIIVVDDGSTDNSKNIVKQLYDDRITLVEKENGGVSSARNKGIELSRGNFIAFLDADDWYETDFLSTMLELINSFSECDAFTSAFNKHSKYAVQNSYVPFSLGVDRESFLVDDFYGEWTKSAFFFTSSIVVRAGYFKDNNVLFPLNENMGEDQDVWFNLAENGKICYTKRVVSNYRVEAENSLTFNNKLNLELPFISRLKDRVLIDEIAGNDVYARQLFIERYELELSVNNAKSGNKGAALSLLLKNMSLRQAKLVLLSVAFILLPSFSIDWMRKLYRNMR